jgi:hypothetical protein
MRVLFDQGTPALLRHALAPHEVSTTFESRWSNLVNGDLLRAAEGRFEVLVTTEQRLCYQRNLTGRQWAMLVLPTKNWLETQRPQEQVAASANWPRPGEHRESRWGST